jgi:hypothetical protein
MTTNDLNSIMEITIKRYKNMLEKFTPCKPGSGEFLEQNLITNFAIAFAKEFPEANVYTEVPFMHRSEFWNCRVDLYIENGDCGYIIEAKGSQQGDALFKLIEEDIERLKSGRRQNERKIGLKNSFIAMTKEGKSLPKNMYGIIIADYWGAKKEKDAQIENKFIQKWNKNEFDDKHTNIEGLMKLPACEVKDASTSYPYWFLAGIIDLKWGEIIE